MDQDDASGSNMGTQINPVSNSADLWQFTLSLRATGGFKIGSVFLVHDDAGGDGRRE